jgi:hypothetical protein
MLAWGRLARKIENLQSIDTGTLVASTTACAKRCARHKRWELTQEPKIDGRGLRCRSRLAYSLLAPSSGTTGLVDAIGDKDGSM